MSNGNDATPSPLQQLGERYGISSAFENAYGRIVAVSADTTARLLDAMGVHVGDPAEAQAALDAENARAAARPLPPTVVVVPEDGLCTVQVRGAHKPEPIDWRITLEDGGERSGSFRVAETSMGAGEGQVALVLSDLPFGYHQLRLPQLGTEAHLIVSPGRCWLPPATEGGHWGIAVQLYLVRSATNWGIGDFSDLRALVEMVGAHGCGLIGLNPLHQMFLDEPEAASPYSPATRLFLNPLYIDVQAAPEWAYAPAAQALVASPAFRARITACRAAPLVDYTEITALKLEALGLLHQAFAQFASSERRAAYAAFCLEKGHALERASLFQVLRQHFAQTDPERVDWRRWSVELRTASSAAMRDFAQQHRAAVDFQNWLQFVADEQLAHAAQAARDQDMAIGLYRDLAVGCGAAGAETWANPAAFLQRTLVGAPPDIFNPAGQNWGLPPFDPVELAQEGYRSFAELIRANMAHSGGLRIDHVMGLQRLFCIPEGNSPAEGAYVRFPIADLVGVLALESQRQQCLVVGEDLGTVPPGFRERMAAANILSYRVLFFEQDFDTGAFLPPQAYPELAFANTGSHDLPTLLAWWTGGDLALKQRLGLFDSPEETASQQERRERERHNILAAFVEAGLLDEAPDPASLSAEHFAQYAHRFLSLTKSLLLATQLDDMTGEVAPVNVPGTWMEYPNWRRKYGMSLEELAGNQAAWSLVAPLSREQAGGPKQAS